MAPRTKYGETSPPGIYIHIPYCISKCRYCDFNSAAPSAFDEDAYVKAVTKDLELKARSYPGKAASGTLYIGGGTPSMLSARAMDAIINATFVAAPALYAGIEATVEVNPDTCSSEKLAAYKSFGINRVSLGIQSFNDSELRILGRAHDAKTALRAFDAARAAGFDNISIDLMFDLPSQDMDSWEQTLKTAIAIAPEHVSVYGLTFEEGTPFHQTRHELEKTVAPEDEQILMYKTALDMLSDYGLRHYEISNLAKPGMESRHNSGYWNSTPYIAIGPGAHSYYAPSGSSQGFGRRLWNERDTAKYISLALNGKTTVAGEETLTKEQAITEAVLTGLRKLDGIDSDAFESRFGVKLFDCLDISTLAEAGLIKTTGGHVALSTEGVLLSNEIFASVKPITI